MANELQHQANTSGITVYALIYNGTAQVWNVVAAAFEAYASASLGNYDVPMTELGAASAFYTADFPAAIANGSYGVVVKQRSGGSPAESDPLLGVGTIAGEVESGISHAQAMQLMLSALVGKVSGFENRQPTFKGAGNSTTRIAAQTDDFGNRSSVVLTPDA